MWGASTDNSGSISYIVRESAGTTRTSGPSSFTWTGLTPNRTYRFTVSAIDPSGNRSAESNQVSATTPASAARHADQPSPANGLRQHAHARVGSSSGGTRYELHSNVAGTYSTTETSRTVHWLFPDTGYSFTVRAFNAAGTPSPPPARR